MFPPSPTVVVLRANAIIRTHKQTHRPIALPGPLWWPAINALIFTGKKLQSSAL